MFNSFRQRYRSQFGGLWIDRIDKNFDLDKEIEHRNLTHLSEEIYFFIENGYVIFKGVVDQATITRIRKDCDDYLLEPEKYVMRKMGKYYLPEEVPDLTQLHRLIDIYGYSEPARQAIAHPNIAEFLNAIFGEPAIGIQSLSFKFGSEQAIHQDPAYVISSEPMKLAASWIALEDVQQGSGELIYYPGSHKFDDYLFSGIFKSWTKDRDGTDDHQNFLSSLLMKAKEKNIAIKNFLPKAGDVLIWHADLAHGGAKRMDPNLTRESLVAHYVPCSVKANYIRFNDVKKHYYEYPINGMFLTSRHYDLRKLATGTKCPVYFDGGTSQKRTQIK